MKSKHTSQMSQDMTGRQDTICRFVLLRMGQILSGGMADFIITNRATTTTTKQTENSCGWCPHISASEPESASWERALTQRDPTVFFSASARLHSAGWSPNQLLSVATLGSSPHAFLLSSAHIKRMLCILGAFPRCGTAAWLVILGLVEEFLRINRLLHAKRFSNPAPVTGKLPSFQGTQFWKKEKSKKSVGC